MNRQERRNLEKNVRKRGVSAHDAQEYVKIIDNADAIRTGGAGTPHPPKKINDGDKVTLNVGLIKERKNYERMSEPYKEFVEHNEGVVFTARVQTHVNIIGLEEEPKWLFWSGDLNKIQDDTSEGGE